MKFYFILCFYLALIDKALPEEYDISKGKYLQYTTSTGIVNATSNILDSTLNAPYEAEYFEDIPNFLSYVGVWFQIDLLGIFNITKIIVWTTNDTRSELTGDFIIFVRLNNKTRFDPDDGNVGEFSRLNASYSFKQGSSNNFTKPNGLLGRYVTLKKNKEINRKQDFVIAELIIISESLSYQVLSLQNPSQNHQHRNDPIYGAEKAIDGFISSCSFTAQENVSSRNQRGWWMVELDAIFDVVSIRIQNDDANNGGIAKFDIYVMFSFNGDPILCTSEAAGIGQSFLDKTYQCSRTIEGKYVMIRKTGGERVDNLLLCEVYVFVLTKAPVLELPANNPTLQFTSVPTLPVPSSSTTQWTTTISISTDKTTTTANSTNVDVNSNWTGATTLSSSKNLSNFTTHDLESFLTSSIMAPSSNINSANKTSIIVGCVVGILGFILLAFLLFFIYKKCYKHREATKRPKFIERISSAIRKSFTPMREEFWMVGAGEGDKGMDLVGLLLKQKLKSKFEFKKLPNHNAKTVAVASNEINSSKNRYTNIFPYDDNIVPLTIEGDEDENDTYINASFIEGYDNIVKNYIATQAPLPGTIRDFWRLVWQYRISTIVMLTTLKEDIKTMSEQYWPSSVHETIRLESISVSLVAEESYADFVCRQILLQDTRFREAPRLVRQLHFMSWPDKKRPDECFPLLAFIKRVNRFNEDANAPILVHCSAGVGRTGTYIAIDYLLDQVQKEKQASVFQCVTSLRLQRMFMVQSADQYEFVYDAVIEGILFRGSGIFIEEFADRYLQIAENHFLEIQQQFDLLNHIRKKKKVPTATLR